MVLPVNVCCPALLCVCVCVRGELTLVAFHLGLHFVPPLYHQTPREALRARGLASPQGLCPVGLAALSSPSKRAPALPAGFGVSTGAGSVGGGEVAACELLGADRRLGAGGCIAPCSARGVWGEAQFKGRNTTVLSHQPG